MKLETLRGLLAGSYWSSGTAGGIWVSRWDYGVGAASSSIGGRCAVPAERVSKSLRQSLFEISRFQIKSAIDITEFAFPCRSLKNFGEVCWEPRAPLK